jgi:acetyl esterase/lipase
LVTRLIFEGKRVTGVEISWDGRTHRIRAGREVIMSLGAINTPKVLMQSGIGDETELRRFGIPVIQHLPGVGHGFQDHPVVACVWECSDPLQPDVAPDAVLFWKSERGLASPDFQILQGILDAADAAKLGLPVSGWTLLGNVVQPKSRGHVRLTGPDPNDPIQIEANLISDPDDRKSLLDCAKLCREIGNLDVLRPFLKREILPGKLKRTTLEDYIRDVAMSFWHQTSTAKMGRDAMSVVDGNLKVYGLDNLRVADASVMPRVTTGNTMAPCVIIGERAAEIIRNQHQIEPLSFPIHGKEQISSRQRSRQSMVSTQNKQMAQFFASVTERMSRTDLDLATIRDAYESLHLAASEPEGVSYAEVDIDGVPALWCIPAHCDHNRVLLHAHGGGTVIFSMHVDRKAVGHIAKAAGARALVLDYRRSPENKFPAQIQDMEKAYHWLLANGIRAENIAVTGQSIGGNLAVSLAIELRNNGVAMPAAILSVSGWYDMELTNDTIKGNAKNDKLLSSSILERFREAWLADTGTAWNDPRVNLLYADLAGLPPIQLYYGDHELLVGEITEFAKRAKDAGVAISLHSVPEGQHNFILGAGRVPEVNKAIEQMGQWLRSRLGQLRKMPLESAARRKTQL